MSRATRTFGTRKSTISRRSFAGSAAALAASLPYAGRLVSAQTPVADFDWQRYAGTEIRVFVPINPAHTTLAEHFNEFEELTGIKVNYEELPENNSRQKLTIEFAGGSSTIDVFTSTLYQEKLLFHQSGWYTPLNEFVDDPNMTNADFDIDDYFAGAAEAMRVDEEIVAVPVNMDTNITYYRKDLLDEAGIAPPTTMDELRAAAEAMHNPPDMFGFVARGQKTSNATQIDPYFRNFGGSYFDDEGNPALNSPENIEAVEFYANMLIDFGPPGVTNFSWAEASQLMQQGRVALYTDGAGFAGPFEDPEKSTVVGKMGYGIFPAGPAGNFPPIYASAFSIYSGSEKKEAAWYFIQWATGKEMTLQVLTNGVAVGRASAWDNPSARENSTLPGEFFDSARQMLEAGVPGLPPIIHVAEARDIISVGLIDVINGGDATEVMNRVQDEFTALVDSERT